MVRCHRYGGPEVLQLDSVAVPDRTLLPAGHALVRIHYAGVNFIDTYHRSCLSDAYKLALPFCPGREGSGVVEAVAAGVSSIAAGDRVCFATGITGSYAEYASIPTASLIKVPDGVDMQAAAACLLQGMTAHYLATSVAPIRPGSTCLVHAAAGGVGRLLCQIAKLNGASSIIGTCGSAAKAEEARRCGADHVILYRTPGISVSQEVRKLTNGVGVDAAFDGVGKDTWAASMDSLKPRGVLALFGNASGPVPPVDPFDLMKRGSLCMTRTSLAHFTADRAELEWRATDVLRWIAEGKLNVLVDRIFSLEDAAQAHTYLESSSSVGKLLIDCRGPRQ